jgi:ABC-2 type transport system permease protein
MGSVSKEKESGTAFFLLVKPVSRLSFLVAKFSSTIIATILSLAIAFLAASLYTYIFFDEFSFTGFAKLNLVMLLYLVSIIFMTIMFSTIFSSQLLAGLFSFLGWMVISIFTQFGEIGKYSPSMLISEANSVIMNSNILWQPFVGAFALMIISFTISYYTFRKWEA